VLVREEKEKWIRAKYELREFLPPLPYGDIPFSQVRHVLEHVVRMERVNGYDRSSLAPVLE
jgi:uncharacterized protein (UPF0128 family)